MTPKYLREGKAACATCSREVDRVYPVTVKYGEEGVGPGVVARHLHRIEAYTPKGALPSGFCPGSLDKPVERVTVATGKRK